MTYRAAQLISYDVVILGSGIAGLCLAHELSKENLRVLLASKAGLIESNSSYAQGGLAAVTGSNLADNVELHLHDTLAAGAGLTDEAVARHIVFSGRQLIEQLDTLGVSFDRNASGFDVALEGGHSHARVLHSKDASGRAITSALIGALCNSRNVDIKENLFALDLITVDGRCVGITFLTDGKRVPVFARHTVLATGGLGQVFSRTTNPLVATGDGIAMAYRAGARLCDMEFVQFHPTALVKDDLPAALVSEAVRGAGATLLDRNGERFAFRFHKDGELATRDVVSRAIYSTMMEQQTNSVSLDLRPIGAANIADRFPNILRTCRAYGFDPLDKPIPIAPAAHYFMGGIWTDMQARTTVPGLYAIGECASTGLHGANRLASNSLLEGGVMAFAAARSIIDAQQPTIQTNYSIGPEITPPPFMVPFDIQRLRQAMFSNVGLERSEQGLRNLLLSVPESVGDQTPTTRDGAEAANIALSGWLIARCALERRESRGSHWRADFPQRDDRQYLRRLFVSKSGSGWLEMNQSNLAASELMPTAANL